MKHSYIFSRVLLICKVTPDEFVILPRLLEATQVCSVGVFPRDGIAIDRHSWMCKQPKRSDKPKWAGNQTESADDIYS